MRLSSQVMLYIFYIYTSDPVAGQRASGNSVQVTLFCYTEISHRIVKTDIVDYGSIDTVACDRTHRITQTLCYTTE